MPVKSWKMCLLIFSSPKSIFSDDNNWLTHLRTNAMKYDWSDENVTSANNTADLYSILDQISCTRESLNFSKNANYLCTTKSMSKWQPGEMNYDAHELYGTAKSCFYFSLFFSPFELSVISIFCAIAWITGVL